MSETLYIENFGPIKKMSFEFKKVNILIGDQGTGKSTVAKILIALQNTFFREIFDENNNDKFDNKTDLFKEHLNLLGIKNYLKSDTILDYDSSVFKLSFKYDKIVVAAKRQVTLSENIAFNFNYIPAERILISTLANALYSLMLNDVSLPKLFLRFGDKFQKGRQRKEIFSFKNILGVEYKYINDRDIVILPSGEEILMQEASSGVQGAIPLLIVFDYVLETSQRDNLLVMEEPELSCFPATQNKLINYFVENNAKALDAEKSGYKNQLLLTTHSPYILTSLNNLMYAYEVGAREPEKVNEIIKKKYWVNPEDVSAYRLMTDGTCKKIISKSEDGTLIDAEEIDEVSRGLNKEFDELIRLEIENAEKR
jgi:predicted ATPase